jgi:hypothetical protein
MNEKKEDEWRELNLRYPMQENGFAMVFSEPEEWIAMMQQYNVVVIPVLNEAECEMVEADMWNHVGPKVTSDPYSWETENWPQPDHPLLSTEYVESEVAFQIRTHPQLYRIFSVLNGTQDLVTTIDVYGVKRATILPNGMVRNDWRPKPLQLHRDTDLLEYLKDVSISEKNRRYQALLAINQCVDNPEEIGGFECVPGSATCAASWARDNIDSKAIQKLTPAQRKSRFKNIPAGNLWHQRVQRLPIPRGCVVVWDAAVAHGNFGNNSLLPRLTMYCRMVPRTPLAAQREEQTITNYWASHPQKKKHAQALHPWSPLQQHLLGLHFLKLKHLP